MPDGEVDVAHLSEQVLDAEAILQLAQHDALDLLLLARAELRALAVRDELDLTRGLHH